MNLLRIQPGQEVIYRNDPYIITRILDLENVLVKSVNSGNLTQVPIAQIKIEDKPIEKIPLLDNISKQDWEIANERFGLIYPIIQSNGNGEVLKKIMAQSGKSKATLYRWIKKYQRTNTISSLLDEPGKGGPGKSRMPKEVEVIVKRAIEEFYLTNQKPNGAETYREIKFRCQNAGLPFPSENTIRFRINSISEFKRLRHRQSLKTAKDYFDPKPDSIAGADTPLALTQIDHAKLNIIVVDEIYRRPIGRPWITVLLDVFSRMVLGFYISLDPPGTIATGLAISHAILKKDVFLAKLNVNGSWPCWGFMKLILADNAKEFRGEMIKMACQEYNIELDWRQVATPHWGAYIERYMGTLKMSLNILPGTTFQKPEDRKDYDSEKLAVFTLPELEKYITTKILLYHETFHNGILQSPISRYKEGIFGSKGKPGIGIPDIVKDEENLRMNFMPFIKRTVQDYGVKYQHLHYYSDVLKNYIHSVAYTNRKVREKQEYTFRIDPRDLSKIYFYDPELKQYFGIPYKNPSGIPMSIWELREVQTMLKKKGEAEIDEVKLFEGYKELKKIQQEVILKSKNARKNLQRQLNRGVNTLQQEILTSPKELNSNIEEDDWSNEIKPFEGRIYGGAS